MFGRIKGIASGQIEAVVAASVAEVGLTEKIKGECAGARGHPLRCL